MNTLCLILILAAQIAESPTESPTAFPQASVTEYKQVLESDCLEWVGYPFDEWQTQNRERYYLHLLNPTQRNLQNDDIYWLALELVKMNEEMANLKHIDSDTLHEIIREEVNQSTKLEKTYGTNLTALRYGDRNTNWSKVLACMMLVGKGKGIEDVPVYLKTLGFWYGPAEKAFENPYTTISLSMNPPKPLPKEKRIRFHPAIFALANNRDSAAPLLMNVLKNTENPKTLRLQAAAILYMYDSSIFTKQFIQSLDKEVERPMRSLHLNYSLHGYLPLGIQKFFDLKPISNSR